MKVRDTEIPEIFRENAELARKLAADGVDLFLVEENLELSETDRVLRNLQALRLVEEFRKDA